jgi:hypothetical protein
MDEYLFITLAKLRFDARKLAAQKDAGQASGNVRPQYQLEEAATTSHSQAHRSPKARWFVPGSDYGEQS